MNFTEWLLNEYGTNLVPFSKKGKIKIYHYLTWNSAFQPPKTIVLDPKLFGKNSYTKNDVNASSVNRIFFYLNPEEKEKFFNKQPLYVATIDAKDIYDLLDDPLNFKKEIKSKNNGVLAVGSLIVRVKNNRKPTYKGYYSQPGDRHVIGIFYPIEAKLLHNPREDLADLP